MGHRWGKSGKVWHKGAKVEKIDINLDEKGKLGIS
jgi:hypothetical protein